MVDPVNGVNGVCTKITFYLILVLGVLCTKGLGFCANYPIIEEQARSKQEGKESFFYGTKFWPTRLKLS